jgi:hypothetical protein
LIDEIAVGAMHLHAVEPSRDRVAGDARIVGDNSLDVLASQFARFDIGLLALVGVGEVRRRGRG